MLEGKRRAAYIHASVSSSSDFNFGWIAGCIRLKDKRVTREMYLWVHERSAVGDFHIKYTLYSSMIFSKFKCRFVMPLRIVAWNWSMDEKILDQKRLHEIWKNFGNTLPTCCFHRKLLANAKGGWVQLVNIIASHKQTHFATEFTFCKCLLIPCNNKRKKQVASNLPACNGWVGANFWNS